MRDFLYLGSAPAEENCVQTVNPNYGVLVQAECQAYLNQIRRLMTEKGVALIPGVSLVVKGCPHDFGTYYEVAVEYNPEEKAPVELACEIESLVPAEWDIEARLELGR